MSYEELDFERLREAVDAAQRPRPQQGRGVKDGLRRALREFSRPQARAQDPVNRQLADGLQALAEASATRGHIEELREWLHATDARLDGQQRIIDELRGWMTDLAQRVSDATSRIQDAIEPRLAGVDAFVASSRAVPDPSSVGLECYEADGAGRVLGYRTRLAGIAPDEDYVAFEDVFRLSEDVIRERQRPYLALVGEGPVLDVGCGRGEFLELLQEAGIEGEGIDLDRGMVARAGNKGLRVREGDGVEYLDSMPDASLGVVFAAQVVEHLPYEHLMSFLRLAAVKLKPGGRLIAETVNPHAPGALKNFWLDLTHQHPVFPEVLLTLCRSIGYASAYVFHPGGSGDVATDRERCGDYALVAERASAG